MEKDISKGYLKYEKNLEAYSGKKKKVLAILYNIVGFAILLITLFAPLLYCEVGEEKFYYSFVKCLFSDGSNFGAVKYVVILGIIILFFEIMCMITFLLVGISVKRSKEKENRDVKNEVCGIDLKYAYSKQGRDCLKAHGRFSDTDMQTLMGTKIYEE